MFLLLTLNKFHLLFWCIFSPLRRSKRHLGIFGNPYLCNILTNIYLFKVNNNMFKINNNVVLVFVFLTLNTFFWCFYCYFEEVFVCWVGMIYCKNLLQSFAHYMAKQMFSILKNYTFKKPLHSMFIYP